MGLGLGFFSFLRERSEDYIINEKSMKKYEGSEESTVYSVLGALIIVVFIPLMAIDIDSYIFQNKFAPYISPLILILAVAAGITTSTCLSAILNGYLIVRDVTHGAIAGAIVVGAGSLYIWNPSFALLSGIIGGTIQTLIQNLV